MTVGGTNQSRSAADLIKRDDALLPCPFCGGDENIICRTDYDDRDAYAVSCRYHNCHGAIFTLGYGYFATKEEAIAAWNTRALPATDPAAIREAALREVLALRRLGQTCFDNIEVMKDGWLIHEDDVKALTGEKK